MRPEYPHRARKLAAFPAVPLAVILFLPPLSPAAPPAGTSGAAEIEFFEKKIRPVLVEKCYSCHSAEARAKKNLRGGLRLDTRAGLRAGGDNGPAIVPGNPADSLLIQALKHDGAIKMPKNRRVSIRAFAR